MAGAVAGLALDAVPPALVRAVDDRRRLARVERQRVPLRRDDLLHVVAVRHVDDVPVVEVEELPRVPLHVVAGDDALAADVVAVDRRLVPVEVHDEVGEGGGAGRGERFAHAAGRQPALALDDVHARGVGAVAVGGAEAQPDRAGDADAGGAGGELDERGGRRRVPVERPGAEPAEQRRRRDRVPPEPEEVLQAEALLQALGQQRRVGHRRHLVAQGPHRVQAHGLVAGRVADQVGVRPVRVAELVVERVEEHGGDEASRRDRAAGVARRGHVVEEEGAERAVEEVERLEVVELGRRQRPAGRHHLRDVDVGAAPRSEGERHGPRSFPPAPPRVRRVPGPDCTSARRLLERVDGDLAVVAGALARAGNRWLK